jgi:hypothetical protein
MTTADTLARLILWGLDQAMAGRPRPLRLRAAPAPTAPLVALVDYVSGFPCLWVTPFAFYGEPTAKLLQALDRCLQSGKLDEVECCLVHALISFPELFTTERSAFAQLGDARL